MRIQEQQLHVPSMAWARRSGPSWLITFADLMALLLVFFVMLLSVSSLDTPQHERLLDALREAFGLAPLAKRVGLAEEVPHMGPGAHVLPGGRGLLPRLETLPQSLPLAETRPQRGIELVALRLPEQTLFSDSGATLSPSGRRVLDRLATLVRHEALDLAVRARSGPDTGSWSRAAERAARVVCYLADKGIEPDRLSATAESLSHAGAAEGAAETAQADFIEVGLAPRTQGGKP